MNIKEIINGYLGDKQINRIYQGSKLVWAKFNYKYMIGGSFTTPKNKIMRLNDDGSIDNTWSNNSSYTSGAFYELIYDNINKKIYGAGDPALEGGLVRYNLNGTKDTSFNIGAGFSAGAGVNGSVRALGIDTINQKIYAGGGFTKYNGSTQLRLVRLNMNGTKDTSFNVGTTYNGVVQAINIDTINQKIYIGGSFTSYNGLVRLNLDGSVDNTFNIGSGFDGSVMNINLDNINQKIYVGGNFTTFNGSTQNRLVRLNMNGTKDNTFNIGTGFNNYTNNAYIYAINIDTNNQKIYVGGNFDTYRDNTQNRLIRLNMNGSKDTSFNIGTGFNGEVNSINIDNVNQKLYVGGGFTTFNGSTQKYMARLNMNGSLDNTFNIQLNSSTRTILKYTE